MVRYLNPDGYNFGPKNFDGYGISFLVVLVTYSLCFYAACTLLWTYRHHPVLKMRDVPLLILSLLVLHVYLIIIMIMYTLNGSFPCQVEFWVMNIYLPIGIGLFQAQNQQLLLVSRRQARLIVMDELYKPFLPKTGRGTGGPKYWRFRCKIWWRGINEEKKYQGFVVIGMVVQFIVSFIIYNISRKFNHYGIVSSHESPRFCRRGWEWLPSIVWQLLWNYFFGPYLIWNVRLIRDIYHWRLQTIVATVAGIPGTPLWLAAVYAKKFVSVNKYWIPPMWFAPGLITMEIVSLGFPIYQMFKHKRTARETNRVLAEFDQRYLISVGNSTASGSLKTRSITSKRGKMYSMESLDDALSTNYDGLQIYASCMELNGENVIFLTRVLAFKNSCQQAFRQTCRSSSEFRHTRTVMFRLGLSIFVSLIHSGTASYPINIESTIYSRLDAIFGPATALVAKTKTSRNSSILTPASTEATPWDDPIEISDHEDGQAFHDENTFSMKPLDSDGVSTLPPRNLKGNESSEHIVTGGFGDMDEAFGQATVDRLHGVRVPMDFDENVFEAAFQSVRYMVWTETWQRYQAWKRGPRGSGAERGSGF